MVIYGKEYSVKEYDFSQISFKIINMFYSKTKLICKRVNFHDFVELLFICILNGQYFRNCINFSLFLNDA